ncbi:hypothetical protein EMCG_08751 [[Emmonsia] crescens]|uniref:Uncharacterized protein n=1 Tax=[Emmonsia] crescens TaxID=73230 RepID=A0A0G2I4B2_9EURO|nr:hypothetical protein EMCG_08751 [Emmonsia crescens UAMH 3008]
MTSNSSQFDASQFSPAIPQPLVLDLQDRINHLKELLTQSAWQKANITKLIELYESGELKPPGIRDSIWLCDGEVINYEPSIEEMSRCAIWHESAYSQMAQSASYGYLAETNMHELFAQFRLDPQLGGNPKNILPVRIANDSGSDMQTTFASDLS